MPLSDEELVSIIESHRRNSLGDESSSLSSERAEAMNRYHGKPYGNEQEGRSQVVSKDLADTVGWMMPAVIKVFIGGGNIAEFSGDTEEDERLAKQESDYVNHVIMKDNQGFLVLYDWFKDTFLLKNGYVKHWWDESETVKEREYTGLDEIGLVKLFMELEQEGSEVEILEQDEERKQIIVPETQQLAEITQFTVRLRITTKKGRVRIEALPPEEVRVSKRARSGTQTSQFIEWFTTKPRTELIEMGMDADWVDALPSVNEKTENDQERYARNSVDNETDETGSSIDRAMDDIQYSEAYLMVDYDQDGKAELRKVITVANNKIPEGEEWNEVIDTVPITSTVSKRVPHRHVGESLNDDLADLSEIKTALMRGLLDNTYFLGNSEYIVNNLANIPDFMKSLPGGLKRIDTDQPIAGMAVPLTKAPIIGDIIPAIDLVDKWAEERTGINELTTNVDADVLKQANNAAFMEGVDRAAQKVEMIIRLLAETGVKELVLRVHEILIKHQDKARNLKLSGEFVSISPTEWRERTALNVSVGLGNGTEEQRRQKLGIAASLQETLLMPHGLVTPSKAFNLYNDSLEALGIESAGRYGVDPALDENGQPSQEYAQILQAQQQDQPNPLAEAEQVKGMMQIEVDKVRGQFKIASEQQKVQFQAAIDEQQRVFEAQLEMLKINSDNREKEQDRVSKEGIATLNAEVELIKAGQEQDIGEPGIGAEVTRTFNPVDGSLV